MSTSLHNQTSVSAAEALLGLVGAKHEPEVDSEEIEEPPATPCPRATSPKARKTGCASPVPPGAPTKSKVLPQSGAAAAAPASADVSVMSMHQLSADLEKQHYAQLQQLTNMPVGGGAPLAPNVMGGMDNALALQAQAAHATQMARVAQLQAQAATLAQAAHVARLIASQLPGSPSGGDKTAADNKSAPQLPPVEVPPGYVLTPSPMSPTAYMYAAAPAAAHVYTPPPVYKQTSALMKTIEKKDKESAFTWLPLKPRQKKAAKSKWVSLNNEHAIAKAAEATRREWLPLIM